jgi:mRNA interferase MazF
VHLASASGNVFLKKTRNGLKRDSVVDVSQLASVNKSRLSESCGKVSDEQQQLVDAGLRRVLSLPQF